MKAVPVRQKVKPGYPDKYAVDLNKMLLYNRPGRWNASPLAGSVLAAVVVLGLTSFSDSKENKTVDTFDVGSYIPLFEHGEGTGAVGCVSAVAPQYLSEEEAGEIIRAELLKAGIGSGKGINRENAILPDTITEPPVQRGKFTAKIGPLETDGVTCFDIGIEFLSMEDYEGWTLHTMPPYDYPVSGFAIYHNLRSAAEILTSNPNLAVFYDPVEMPRYDGTFDKSLSEDESRKEIERILTEITIEAKERAEENLREQVRDFIAWLSAQGVI
jgi:hypothetical protein